MSNKILCGIGCGVCCLLTILIFVLVSVGTVEPIEYGIVYNSITKTVNTEHVYKGGWYFIGPIQSFFVFPSTLINIDFTDYKGADHPPIEVKDKIGQTVTLSFSLQYKLLEDDIGKLYENYQQTYLTTYLSRIDNAVRQVFATFDSDIFWKDRKQAGEAMKEEINKVFQDPHSPSYAKIYSLQVINIGLPQRKEQQLIQSQVAIQQAFTKKKEQEAKEIRSGISVRASEADKNITQIQGRAQASAKEILANATSEATQTVINATSFAYKLLDTELGIKPGAGLDQFIFYNDLQTSDDVDYLVGIKNALISLKK